MRRAKGFTLVELLVVIAIIALLMGILMPALARVRAIAFRMTCGTNLSGIGKAMMIYANDYDDEFPIAGWPNGDWAYDLDVANGNDSWSSEARIEAFGDPPGSATITSCFYILVKYADVTPKSFICKSDIGVKEFVLSDYGPPLDSGGEPMELVDVWDFGASTDTTFHDDQGADAHCSYAYHLPFCTYPLTTASEPAMAVAADPNPWFDHAGTARKNIDQPSPFEGPYGSKAPFDPDNPKFQDTDHIKFGNSIVHQEEGQNVLYVDGSVAFEKNSFCGIEQDNIYTVYNANYGMRRGGLLNSNNEREPYFRSDSFLVGNLAEPGAPEL